MDKNKFLYALFAAPWLFWSVASAQVEVNFVDSGQTVPESGEWTVTIELSEPSLLEVSVPYRIASESTATLGSDFEIPEDVIESGVVVEDNESPIVFAPGEVRKSITVEIINDAEVESDELIIFELLSEGLTVARLGDQTRHTIRIIDNDPIRAYFRVHEGDFFESGNIAVSVRLSEAAEQDVIINYNVTTLTASSNDIDLTSSTSTKSPLRISAGSTLGTIVVAVVNDSVTDRNEGGADRETVQIQLQSATLEGGGQIDVDTQPYIATIIDNDPITVQFAYGDDVEFPIELDEHTSTSLRIVLLGPDGELTTSAQDVSVPVSYGGTVVIGDGENDDLDPEEGPIVVPAGQSNVTFALNINNDDNVEEDELLTVTLGQPSYQNGGDLILGDKSEMRFVIKDNDPVSLSFAAVFSKDDYQASQDPEYEDIRYVPSAGSVVARQSGQITIPVVLSSLSANNAEFKLELLSEGTSANLFSAGGGEDQDWDFAITSHSLPRLDSSVDLVIRSGLEVLLITVALNNEVSDPIVFGQESEAARPDKTVRFRISGLNTSTSKVNPGQHMDYTLTIRDLPDVDITDVMSGLSPLESSLANGGLRFNDQTGLFEADYRMQPSVQLDPSQFPGYRSMKFVYRTTNYDASNPEAESNDPVVSNPTNPAKDQEFHFFVNPPFQVRFPHSSRQIKLIEGAEPKDGKYDITTADTIETAPYLLHPLSFPRLNDFEADIRGAYDANDVLEWTVPFYSRGYFFFPVDRIDPASNPDRLRVYLTGEGTSVFGSSSGTATISEFKPLADGSVFMVIESGAGSSNVQIQYLDPGDEWRIVHPQAMSTGGASQFYWIDQGPPHTQTHPKNVPFRLYRASVTRN